MTWTFVIIAGLFSFTSQTFYSKRDCEIYKVEVLAVTKTVPDIAECRKAIDA